MIKINNKLIIIIILIIIVIVGGFIFFQNKNKNNSTQEGQIEQTTDSQVTESEEDLSRFKDIEYTIESTSENKIEKDGIEAQSIYIKSYTNELEIKTTLKNNSSEKVEGYMIEIELLDDEGNTMTTISDNSQEVLEAGETKEMLNYVVGLENQDQIRNAKIISLEKNNIEETMEKSFEGMIPDEVKEMKNTENNE